MKCTNTRCIISKHSLDCSQNNIKKLHKQCIGTERWLDCLMPRKKQQLGLCNEAKTLLLLLCMYNTSCLYSLDWFQFQWAIKEWLYRLKVWGLYRWCTSERLTPMGCNLSTFDDAFNRHFWCFSHGREKLQGTHGDCVNVTLPFHSNFISCPTERIVVSTPVKTDLDGQPNDFP